MNVLIIFNKVFSIKESIKCQKSLLTHISHKAAIKRSHFTPEVETESSSDRDRSIFVWLFMMHSLEIN